ncbi:hypothetical protein [Nonomuraea insulae]|uniref:RHS repeat-associated protein n=1 Tax=Nonomuraea insulae TaxID=1616787 RepID=A0ABW1CS35_9ACTN
MLRLDDLREAADAYTGTVRFTLPLASLAGVGDVLLSYDSGMVDAVRDGWNLAAPTGVAGLGWTLETDRISMGPDGYRLRLNGAGYRLLPDGDAYVTTPHTFWRCTRTTGDAWTVILDDGTRLVFGGDGENGAVEWGHTVGGWTGASVQTKGRRRAATGWWLSSRTDVWGNTTTYTYLQDTAQLAGGAPFTRATYLRGVEGHDGGRLELAYTDKDPREYADPHHGSPAWQSRYGTRALASVAAITPAGTTLTITTLGYGDTGGPATIGTGDRIKRLLTTVGRTTPGGYPVPAVGFGYDLSAISPSHGALLTVTTSAGGVAEFAYNRPAPALARRDIPLTPPPRAGRTEPGITFGDDYAVVLWPGDDGTTTANAYRWEGRWVGGTVPVPAGTYESLRVIPGTRCFAIVGATTYTLFHADPETPGGWTGSATAEPIGLPADEAVAAAGADGALALLASRTGTMVVRWFDGAAWQRLDCAAPAGTTLASLDGAGETITRICAGGPGPDLDLDLTLVRPHPVTGWSAQSYRLRSWTAGLNRLNVAQGDGFAVLTCEGLSGTERAVTWQAVRWDAGAPVTAPLGGRTTSDTTGAFPPVALRRDTVLIGQDAYRYDGAGWFHQDLSLLARPGDAVLTLGGDHITRATTSDRSSDGATTYDLIVYDPAAAGAGRWGYAEGLSGVSVRGGTAAAARFGSWQPGATSRYAIIDTGLVLLGASGGWTRAFDLDAAFTGAELFAESYLIYQSGTGADAGITAVPLEPGSAATPIRLRGARLTGAGATAFAAYTGVWNEGAKLRLYRAVTGDVRGPLTPLAVTSVKLHGSGVHTGTGPDGAYNTVSIGYAVASETATVSADGHLLASARTTVAPGTADATRPMSGRTVVEFFNGLTSQEAAGLSYPAGLSTNAAAHLSRVRGVQHSATCYTQDGGTEVTRATGWWWATPARTGPRAMGAWVRSREDVTAVDGVPQHRTQVHDARTGRVTRVGETLPDGTAVETAFTYWWEVYDPDRTANLLTPVVQIMTSAAGMLTEGMVTAWDDDWGSGPGCWAPSASYVATRPDPRPFTQWRGQLVAPEDGWLPRETVTSRTAGGLVTRTRDTLGRRNTTLYGGAGSSALFGGADVMAGEAYFYGCEPGESPGPWRYRAADRRTGPVEAHLVAGESNLGTRSLRMVSDLGGIAGPFASFVPEDQDRTYLFSCWAQTPPGYTAGEARFEITISTLGESPQRLGDAIPLDVPATGGGWRYLSGVIPLAARRGGQRASVTIRGRNAGTSAQVLVDGLRFQPVDAAFHAEVTHPLTGLPLGSLGPNGATFRLIRDANRIVTATLGPDDSVARLRVPGFARLLTSDGDYAENLPNTLLEAVAGDGAVHQNFEASDRALWDLPSGWDVAAGRLTFAGTGGEAGTVSGPWRDRALLKGFSAPDYVVYVQVLPPGTGEPTPPGDVAVGCGNVLVSHKDGAWSLKYLDGSTWRTPITQSGDFTHGDLVFSVLDGRVSLFASGRQILSARLPGLVPDGTLGLSLTGPGAFANLIALTDPELRMTLHDGRGIAQQSLELRDSQQVEARGVVYDDLGRVAYGKNPVLAPVAATGNLIAGGATAYLPSGNQTLQHYLERGNGSPFTRIDHERSPLTRPLRLGLPGDDLAVGGDHAATMAYARNTVTGPMRGLVPDAAAGNHRLLEVTGPDGALAHALATPGGRLVAQRVELGDGTSLTRGYAYDAAGQLTRIEPPSSFDGGTGRPTTFGYDFLGRLTLLVTPETGSTRFAYDGLGRPRFRMDAAGAAASPVRIGYRRLDRLGRVVEAGTIADTAVAWEAAIEHVDDPRWPGTGVAHEVRQSFVYDTATDGAGAEGGAAINEGRLTSVAGTGVTESYAYDTRGQVTRYRVSAPAYADTVWESSYAYDGRGRPARIDLPKAVSDGSPPLSVAYTYDRTGRVVAVGAPPDEGAFQRLGPRPDTSGIYSRFAYNPDGTPRSISYADGAVPVRLDYTAAGWPERITTGTYSEEIGYADGGYPGPGGYHDGKVARRRSMWFTEPGALYPVRDTTERFGYDTAGRVIAAMPYLGGAGDGVTYYRDGNLREVRRGDSLSVYRYTPKDATRDVLLAQTESDRVLEVETTLTTGCDFDRPSAGWTWGSANAGPGGPAVEPVVPDQNAKCLRLPGGGSPGGSCYLEYRWRFDARGSYTVAYRISADADLAGRPGVLGWYVTVSGPDGPLAHRLVRALDGLTTTWSPQSFTLDLATLPPGLGASGGAGVTEVALRLVNGRNGALRVDDVTISGTGSSGSLDYDPAGRVTGLPSAGVGSLTYTPGNDAVSGFASAGVCPYDVGFGFDAADRPVCRVAAPDGDGFTVRSLTLRTPAGSPLAQFDAVTDVAGNTTVRRRYLIPGPFGAVAVEDDGRMSYPIRGADGGVRAVVDPDGRLIRYSELDAFGRPQSALPRSATSGKPLLPLLAEELDPLSGLAPHGTAPYDPVLGRALTPAADPGGSMSAAAPDPLAPAITTSPYGDGWFGRAAGLSTVASGLVTTVTNVLHLHFVTSWKYIPHAWPVHGLVAQTLGWNPYDWSVFAMTMGGPPATRTMRAAGALMFLTPQLYGLPRWAYNRYLTRSCADRGLFGIGSESLAEDVYHLQFYGPMETIGGQRLRPLPVAPIPDGFYIFVMDEDGVFRYRDMSDRAGGHELYVRHSQLNGGGCAQTAGMLRVRNKQRDIVLTNSSGHYTPSLASVEQWAIPALREAGYLTWRITAIDFTHLNLAEQMHTYLKDGLFT